VKDPTEPKRPGLLAAAAVLDGYLTMHPDCPGGKDIYHLLQELYYMAENPDDYVDEAREIALTRLADQFWITLADDGIHFTNSPEGCSPDQAREFAGALMIAATLYENPAQGLQVIDAQTTLEE
jgi:hypothetical protein